MIHIGFIGLGAMGEPMARNLLRAGYALTVYNRSPEKTTALADAGAQVAARVADVAERCQVVVTMLANDAAVNCVAEGEQGLIACMAPGSLHISMSTVGPGTTRQLAAAHQDCGSRLVSAPVFGKPDAAAAQKLWICLAGATEAKAEATPVLLAMGQGVRDFGIDPGAANIVKLCGNYLILSATQAMAEAFALGEKSGIDRVAMSEFFGETLFAGPVYQNYGRTVAHRRYTPAGFKLALGLKDIKLVRDVAEQQQVPMAFADVLYGRLLGAMANGQAELDWAAIELQVAANAGLRGVEAN